MVATLTAQITNIQVCANELQAVVNLIAAVGGGWSLTDLPDEDGILAFNPLSLNDA